MFKSLLYIAILTSAIVASWIGFEVYNSHVTSTITNDKSIIITPIPENFDNAALNSLKSKKIISSDLAQESTRSGATLPQEDEQQVSTQATNAAVQSPNTTAPLTNL